MKQDNNCLFIILGVTGDLTKKKLIPAIYNLILDNKIGNFAIVGISRSDFKADNLLVRSKGYIKRFNQKIWNKLKKRFYYFKADFYDEERFEELKYYIQAIEKKHKLPGNKIFYLATPSKYFEVIASNLDQYKIAEQEGGWSRIVFEKPFGNDLKSAKKINKCIMKVFDENQIYRIDHYLGKELVENISVLRFTNAILEPLWCRDYIDHVQIILSENVGIEERGAFYDQYGALKDVLQNHMMQLLCLTTMNAPKQLNEQCIRDEKVKILKAIRKIGVKGVVLGQYIGYKKEKNIKRNSNTETFAALKLYINNNKWKNVPFYFITGKKMKDKITSIYIEFKQPNCLLFKGICNYLPNYLTIQIQPEEGFYLRINAKIPDRRDIKAVKMEFCHKCLFGPNTPEAYENLLFNVIKGDQSVFVRYDEIEQQWRIIDKVTKKKLKIYSYKQGSYPRQVEKLIEKDNRSWHLEVK